VSSSPIRRIRETPPRPVAPPPPSPLNLPPLVTDSKDPDTESTGRKVDALKAPSNRSTPRFPVPLCVPPRDNVRIIPNNKFGEEILTPRFLRFLPYLPPFFPCYRSVEKL